MGFGIMFIGCCFMLLGAFTTLSVFTYVLGSAIVLYSLKDLIKQNKIFLISMALVGVEFIISMVNMFVYVLSNSSDLITIFSVALPLVNVINCTVLLTAIFVLAKSVDLPSLQTKIVVTYIFIGIYFICLILGNTVLKSNEFAMTRIAVVTFFAQLIYTIMTLLCVANSYMRICYEDDLDMSKKTGNKSLDFLNDKFNYAMTPREKKDKNKGDKK